MEVLKLVDTANDMVSCFLTCTAARSLTYVHASLLHLYVVTPSYDGIDLNGVYLLHLTLCYTLSMPIILFMVVYLALNQCSNATDNT